MKVSPLESPAAPAGAFFQVTQRCAFLRLRINIKNDDPQVVKISNPLLCKDLRRMTHASSPFERFGVILKWSVLRSPAQARAIRGKER
jgi:hypothetical protein